MALCRGTGREVASMCRSQGTDARAGGVGDLQPTRPLPTMGAERRQPEVRLTAEAGGALSTFGSAISGARCGDLAPEVALLCFLCDGDCTGGWWLRQGLARRLEAGHFPGWGGHLRAFVLSLQLLLVVLGLLWVSLDGVLGVTAHLCPNNSSVLSSCCRGAGDRS
jgi:hypothetical protein